MHILYIEDDLIDQKLLGRILKDYSYIELHIANSVAEGLEIIQNHKLDLVITDYYIGNHTAEEVVEMVDGIPIVVVSGIEDTEKIELLYKAGIAGHILKPLQRNVIENLIGEFSNLSMNTASIKNEDIQLNLKMLHSYADGDLTVQKEILSDFATVLEECAQKIKSNIEPTNRIEIAEALHKCTSNLRFFGLTQIGLKTTDLEQHCKSEIPFDKIKNDLEILIPTLKNVVKAAKAELILLN